MTEHEDFNQPGINILEPWFIADLKNCDPRSTFAWTFYENRSQVVRYVFRKEYIKLQIRKKLESK